MESQRSCQLHAFPDGDACPTGAFLAQLRRLCTRERDPGLQEEAPVTEPSPAPATPPSPAGSAPSEEDAEVEADSHPHTSDWDYLEVTADGGIAVHMNLLEAGEREYKQLAKAASSPPDMLPFPSDAVLPPGAVPAAQLAPPLASEICPLNIVMLVSGTRGDVQPFIAIGMRLAKDWGHRVRLATHAVYRAFVEDAGLEFFPIGGDPTVLIQFVVKHRGILPGLSRDMLGEVAAQKHEIADIVAGTWGACTEPDPGRPDSLPFRADAIYANPTVFAHMVVAEALGVPCHVCFTMPWSPTTAFPSPMIRVFQNNNHMLHGPPHATAGGRAAISRTTSVITPRGGASAIPAPPRAPFRSISVASSGGSTVGDAPPAGVHVKSAPAAAQFISRAGVSAFAQAQGAGAGLTADSDGSGDADVAWSAGDDPSTPLHVLHELPPEVEAMFAGNSLSSSSTATVVSFSPLERLRTVSARRSSTGDSPTAGAVRSGSGRLRSMLSMRSGHSRGHSADEASALSAFAVAGQHEPEGYVPPGAPQQPATSGGAPPRRQHQRTGSLPSFGAPCALPWRRLGSRMASTAAASAPSVSALSFGLPRSKLSSTIAAKANWYSYMAANDIVWLGCRKPVAELAEGPAGLGRNHPLVSAHAMHERQVPITYIWSPSLVPRPHDWGPHISVVGFAFLPEDAGGADYTPAPALAEFLAAGPPPVYIGVGSLVVGDPGRLTHRIYKALATAGVRGLVQRGWGGLGTGTDEAPPPGVLVIDACPHEWLFPRCAAVIHHGGAGTTATGLRHGRPTLVIPFFGDQPFWGQAVHHAGAGPRPLPIDRLNSRRLAAAIQELLEPHVAAAAQRLANCFALEDGVGGAVDAFHAHLSRVGTFAAKRRASWREFAAMDATGAASSRATSRATSAAGQEAHAPAAAGAVQGAKHKPDAQGKALGRVLPGRCVVC